MKEYLFKTLISFISLNATLYITRDSWLKFTTNKKHGFFKRLFNRLTFCLIPVFRWIWIVLVLFIGLLLFDEEYSNKVKQRMNEKEKQDKGKDNEK